MKKELVEKEWIRNKSRDKNRKRILCFKKIGEKVQAEVFAELETDFVGIVELRVDRVGMRVRTCSWWINTTLSAPSEVTSMGYPIYTYT